jgi:hypothetical protein
VKKKNCRANDGHCIFYCIFIALNLFYNVWIMKLRISTFKNNGKLKWNLRNFIHYFRTTQITCKKIYTQFVGLLGIYWYLLHGLLNSRSFNGLQLFSDLCHQELYIFWTIIVAVDLPFQVRTLKIFRSAVSVGRLVDFLPLGRIQFLVLLIGPTYSLRSVQTPNQARTQYSWLF